MAYQAALAGLKARYAPTVRGDASMLKMKLYNYLGRLHKQQWVEDLK